MRNQKRLGLIVITICCLLASNVQAAPQWTAVDLHPGGFVQSSQIVGVSAKDQVGNMLGADSAFHAVIWNGSAGSMIDRGYGMMMASNVNEQVGISLHSSGRFLATRWIGKEATFLKNPAGVTESMAYSISGQTYGGYIMDGSGYQRAIYWSSYSSYKVVHPTGLLSSVITAISNGVQTGFVRDYSYNSYAAKWTGSGSSFVNLHPSGYDGSIIRGMDGNTAVGWTILPNGISHAGIWNLSSGQFIDANVGFYSSAMNGISGIYYVGVMWDINGVGHAYMWDISGNLTDLHNILPAGQYSDSSAFGVWQSGGYIYVGGLAISAVDGNQHAILWRYQ